jgi:hypothetical protein
VSDDLIHAMSHARGCRSVTPFRSGPIWSPFPKVWQLVHFVLNNADGSAVAAPPSDPIRTSVKIVVVSSSREQDIIARGRSELFAADPSFEAYERERGAISLPLVIARAVSLNIL